MPRKKACKRHECICTRCIKNANILNICTFAVSEHMRSGTFQQIMIHEHRLLAPENKPITMIIHVLSSHGSKLDDFVVNALREKARMHNTNVNVSTLVLATIREDPNWTLAQVMTFLIECHCYFIINHPHQGTQDLQWSMQEFYSRLQCLSTRIGFPSGPNLRCPVFTQNKGLYLYRAKEYCNPSLIIELSMWYSTDYFVKKNILIKYVKSSAWFIYILSVVIIFIITLQSTIVIIVVMLEQFFRQPQRQAWSDDQITIHNQ